MSLLKAYVATLRASVSDFLAAHIAESLVALKAVMRICHKVEADWTSQNFFKESVSFSTFLCHHHVSKLSIVLANRALPLPSYQTVIS